MSDDDDGAEGDLSARAWSASVERKR